MKEPTLLSPGVFADCAIAPNWQIVVAYRVHERRADGWIEVHWLGGETFPIATGMDDSSFCRLFAWQGRLWLMYRALRAGVASACLRELFPDRLGMERPLGQGSGSSPVCFGDGGWAAWQNVTDGVVWGLNLEAGGDRVLLRDSTRPTGLSRIWHGGVRFIDEDRFLASPAMLNPVYAGQCVVGEGPDGGLAVRLTVGKGVIGDEARDVHGFIMPGECNVPRVAWDGAGRYVAVTWGGPGVRVLEFTEADIGPLPVAPVTMPAIGRPCWLGWFVFLPLSRELPPGHCSVIVPYPLVRLRDGQAIAVYTAGEPDGDLSALERAIAVASDTFPGLSVLAYLPLSLQGGRLPAGAIPLFEAYRRAGESVSAFESRLRTEAGRVVLCWFAVQCFTSNNALTDDLASVVVVVAKIARDMPQVQGLLCFSAGAGRATGYDAHPEVHALYQQLAAGIPSAPPIDNPQPPAPKTPPDKPEPQEPPMSNAPTPHQWITEEFPQLEAQFVRSGLGVPNANMAAFLTLRRYGYFAGEDWPFSRLMADLVQQGRDNGSIPPEPP